MTFYNIPKSFSQRRRLLKAAALGLGSSVLPVSLHAQQALQQVLQSATQAEVKNTVDAFLQGAVPLNSGLKLEMPALGDNPAAVPVKVVFDKPATTDLYCEELIIIAENNPKPLACRFKFTQLSGTSEVAVRLRLMGSQSVQALARLNDGSYLLARQHITVTAGGCGM